jgi:hypothetical protein
MRICKVPTGRPAQQVQSKSHTNAEYMWVAFSELCTHSITTRHLLYFSSQSTGGVNLLVGQRDAFAQKKHKTKQRVGQSRNGIPELELWEAAGEGLELVGAAGGEARAGLELRVDHGGEEADEEVEQVDAQAVGHHVEAPRVVDPYTATATSVPAHRPAVCGAARSRQCWNARAASVRQRSAEPLGEGSMAAAAGDPGGFARWCWPLQWDCAGERNRMESHGGARAQMSRGFLCSRRARPITMLPTIFLGKTPAISSLNIAIKVSKKIAKLQSFINLSQERCIILDFG